MTSANRQFFFRVRPRGGMTLVELMVAIALSAMLMVALVGVLGGISKQVKISDRFDQPVWPSRFATLLRRDLGAAESIWVQSGVLWMRTDVPGYQSNLMGVRPIGYRCVNVEPGLELLERIDQEQGASIALGPTEVRLTSVDRSGREYLLPEEPVPVPERLRVRVWEDTNDPPILVRDILVR